MIKIFVYIIFAGLTLWLSEGCGTAQVVDTGGASETVSIIITDTVFYGKALITDNDEIVSVNSFVDVHFYESDFLPMFPLSDKNITSSTATDISGEFSIRHTGVGYYSIYSKDAITGKTLFCDSVEVLKGKLDTIEAVFDIACTISGSVSVVDTASNDTTKVSKYYVYAIGTPFWTTTGSLGAFLLDTLPKGSYLIKAFNMTQVDTSLINEIEEKNTKSAKIVSVIPGDTVGNIDIFIIKK